MDQDDALAKLDEIAESKGESLGELSDAGERLDSMRDSTSALLLLFKPSEQLRRQQQLRMRALLLLSKLLVTRCVCENQSWMFAVSVFVTSQTNAAEERHHREICKSQKLCSNKNLQIPKQLQEKNVCPTMEVHQATRGSQQS